MADRASTRARKAAVIGCGDVSTVHFGALATLPNVELVAVCDTDAGRADAAAAAYDVPAFADHRELLSLINPDIVHICTPHDTHARIAIDALDAGVNVILEKPLADTIEAGRRVVAAAQRSSAKIAVCFQNRYNAPNQAAFRLLRSGTLGAILGGSGTVIWHRTADYYADRPWRGQWASGGGGLLMNQAIHTLDLMQWLIGDVATARGGVATRLLGDVIEVEDTADLILRHKNGARSVFYATLANVVNDAATIEIATEQATLSLRGALTVRYSDGRVENVRERETTTDGRDYWGVSHELLIRDFYGRLDDAAPFWISPTEAQKTLKIIQDVYDQSIPDRLASDSMNMNAMPSQRSMRRWVSRR
ncbi:MAG TPA: Gfo/Idh/MocA family oxidoreductase [Microbacteriaceae bacterium]